MSDTVKVLAQSNPSAASLTDAYTVAASTVAVVSQITVCNRSAVPTAYRISVAVAGAADDNKQYIAYDAPIGANEVIELARGVSLAATDKIRVYATLATLAFNVFGVEQT